MLCILVQGITSGKTTQPIKKKGNVLESGGWRRTNIKPKEKLTQKKLNNVIMLKANMLKVSQLQPVSLLLHTCWPW